MSLLDLHSDELVQAGTDTAATAVPRAAPSKFSAWKALTAPARGAREGVAQGLASGAELMGMFGEVLGAYPEAMGATSLTGEQRQQADAQRLKIQREGLDATNPIAESLRTSGAMYRPDPVDAHAAEQIMYGFARGAAKVVGGAVTAGPTGVVGAGIEEAMTQAEELRQQGVPFRQRVAAGAVQGGGLALAALPLVGNTLGQTAALYVAGGPGGFVAQQALTREILRTSNPQLAEQFDPFEPVGLAVATLLPASFTVHALRAQKMRARLLQDVQAQDYRAPAPEVVDAAMVQHLAETRASAHVHTFGKVSDAGLHEMAMAAAERQLAAGERVHVSDMIPRPQIEASAQAAAQIDALRAEGAQLLPVAADLADAGQIRLVKAELATMEQQRPDASDAAIRARAKDIQAQDGASYKAALSEAKKQVAGEAADFEARQQALQAQISRNAEAQRADQRLRQIETQAQRLEEQLAPGLRLVRFGQQISQALREYADQLQPQARAELERQAATRNVPEEPRAPQPDQAQDAQGSATTRGAGAPAAEPAGQPRPTAGVEAAGVTPGQQAEAAAAVQRLDQIRADFPDLQVMVDGMEKPMRLDEFMAAVKAEADGMLQDAPLLQMAAECALLNAR